MLELTLDDLLQLVKKASFHLPPLDPAVEAIMRDWRKTGRNPRHLDSDGTSLDLVTRNSFKDLEKLVFVSS